MVNRLSALWLVAGAIAGYAIAGSSVGAQSSGNVLPTAFNPGDSITLHFERGAIGEYNNQEACTVAEAQGQWVRCASEDKFGRPSGGEWYNLRRVFRITKQEK